MQTGISRHNSQCRHSVAMALMVAIAFMTSQADPARSQTAPPAFPVTVATPLLKHIKTWDEYPGRFEAVARVELRPRVSGYVDQVNFKEGSTVKQGDLLFTLDKRPFEIAVESAKAEVARAKAQVDFAKADVDRAAPLVESKALSEQVFEQRRSTLGVAEAQVMSAAAQLRSAQLNLEWAEVRAPISGRISDKKIDVGNLVLGGQVNSTLMATIVTTDPIHFVFDASEADYMRYARLNQSGVRPSSRVAANPVRVKLADESEWSHEGVMDFVDNAFNQRSGTIRGRAILSNKDDLLTPGLFARIALYGGDVDAFLIPDTAIISDQARKIVYTVNADDVIAATPVTLGQMYEGLRVIKAGLKADDRVVIEGVANPAVRPGTKVAPTNGTIKPVEKTAQN
ncbi:RND family efflux transporter, MFP subunit [Hyphomicrobium facile]|uniref:RND family efflux transporter, MFP subunit n=2 Tax=Hyphomicrobium facile TaxID=51670 RepID=A0A1I7NEW4_9HYPH|nr:RND family efflux transporter, MFP subunit [Hyphomicrobium facile]